MTKKINKKPAKEASNIFHNIMKASVSVSNPKEQKYMKESEIINEIEMALSNRFPSLIGKIKLSIKTELENTKHLFYQFPKDFDSTKKTEASSIITKKAADLDVILTTEKGQ